MFKNLGHFFASAFQKVLAIVPKVEATEGTVETVSAEVPVYGPLAVTVEKAGYAVLGELAAVLNAGGAAAQTKLSDAGLDINVIKTVQALLAGIPQLATLAKSL